jgi:hypothetical protein
MRRKAQASQTYQVDLVANFFGCFMILWLIGLPNKRRIPSANEQGEPVRRLLIRATAEFIDVAGQTCTMPIAAPSGADRWRLFTPTEPLGETSAPPMSVTMLEQPLSLATDRGRVDPPGLQVDWIRWRGRGTACESRGSGIPQYLAMLIAWQGRTGPHAMTFTTAKLQHRLLNLDGRDFSNLYPFTDTSSRTMALFMGDVDQTSSRTTVEQISYAAEWRLIEDDQILAGGTCLSRSVSSVPDDLTLSCTKLSTAEAARWPG